MKTRVRQLLPDGLSARLLMLTAVFVLLAEVLIFVPSVANFRLAWLQSHFEAGEAIARVLDRVDDAQSTQMAADILDLTGTDLIAIRRDGTSRILAQRLDAAPMVDDVARVDLAMARPGAVNAMRYIGDAMRTLLGPWCRRRASARSASSDPRATGACWTW